jgi:hypothetical protein
LERDLAEFLGGDVISKTPDVVIWDRNE